MQSINISIILLSMVISSVISINDTPPDLPDLNAMFDDLDEANSKIAKATGKKIEDEINKKTDPIKKAASDIISKGTDKVIDKADAVVEKVDKATRDAWEVTVKAYNDINSLYVEAVGEVKKSGNIIQESLSKALQYKKMAGDIYAKSRESFKEAGVAVKEIIANGKKAIYDIAAKAKQAAAAIKQQAIETVEYAKSQGSKVSDAWGNFSDAFKLYVLPSGEKVLLDAGEDAPVGGKIVDDLEELRREVVQKFGNGAIRSTAVKIQ